MAGTRKGRGKSAPTKGPVATIGVIGGSGLYSMNGLSDARELRVKTPFGDPSDAIVVGSLEGKRVAFLARHGRGHRFMPTELNFRANIYAMKRLGVERIISVSAVGSLQESLRPGEFLVVDQFFDRTKGRVSTFFGNGVVAHVTFDKPTCAQLSAVLADACVSSAVPVHRKGTYICMTNVTEAKLAREAEICYATIAMITDYDCWHPEHDSVTVSTIVAMLNQNASNAQNVVREAVKTMPAERKCNCGSALKHAIITDPRVIPGKTKRNLAAVLGKYLR